MVYAFPNRSEAFGGAVATMSGTAGLLAIAANSPCAQQGWSGYQGTHSVPTIIRPERPRNVADQAAPSGCRPTSSSGAPANVGKPPKCAIGSGGSWPSVNVAGSAVARSIERSSPAASCSFRSTTATSRPTWRPTT